MRKLIIAFALLACSNAYAQDEAYWATFTQDLIHSQETRRVWFEVEEEKRDRIATYIMKTLHLMMDGRIEVIGSYRLHEASKLGKEEDRIFHFIQKNRENGSRLYWSCLVNVDSMKLKLLYSSSDSSKVGVVEEIINYNPDD